MFCDCQARWDPTTVYPVAAKDSEALYQSNRIDVAQKVTTAAAHLGFQILAGSGRNSVPVVNFHPCCVLVSIRSRGLCERASVDAAAA
jgi:hypothetical protein